MYRLTRKKVPFFTLFALIGIQFFIFSQESGPIKVWDKRYGGVSRDTDVNTIRTSDNGFLITASSLSGISGNKTTPNRGNDDWWIIKTDEYGEPQWELNIGGTSEEGFEAGAFESHDGTFVLAGRTRSGISGDITSTRLGSDDILVVKITSTGELVWQKRLGGNGADVAYDIVNDTDGNIIIGGYTNSFNIQNNPPKGSLDAYLIKLNSNGEIIWERTFGGSGFESLDEIRPLSNGGIAAGGYSASTDLSVSNNGSFDFWLFEVDADGNQVWENLYGGSGLDAVRSMSVTKDGGILLGGQSNSTSSGDRSQENRGQDDMWLVKTNAAGELEWEVAFGGDGLEWAQAITPLSNETFLVGGFSNSTRSGDKERDGLGGFDIWYLKSNSQGEILWQGLFGGTGDEAGLTIPLYDEQTGEIYMSGSTSSNLGNYFSTASFGSSDIWLAKLQVVDWSTDTLKVCQNVPALIEIPNSIPGKVHILKDELGNIVGSPATGNGESISLLTDTLVNSASFNVYVQSNLADGNLFEEFLGNVFVEVGNPIDLTLLDIKYNSQICFDKRARVRIPTSDIGSVYQLVNNSGEIVDSKEGNGEKLVLKSPKLKEDTEYRLQISNGSCIVEYTEPIHITVLPELEVSIRFNPNGLRLGRFIEFSTNDDSRIVSWTWEFGNGKKAQGKRVRHCFNRLGAFEIKLTVENENGCKKVFKKTIRIKDDVFISAPGVFRPHSRYGIFKVKLKEAQRESLLIRNLQGHFVYKGKNAWSGNHHRGGKAKAGWYIYHVRARLSDGTPYTKRGLFYLKR